MVAKKGYSAAHKMTHLDMGDHSTPLFPFKCIHLLHDLDFLHRKAINIPLQHDLSLSLNKRIQISLSHAADKLEVSTMFTPGRYPRQSENAIDA